MGEGRVHRERSRARGRHKLTFAVDYKFGAFASRKGRSTQERLIVLPSKPAGRISPRAYIISAIGTCLSHLNLMSRMNCDTCYNVKDRVYDECHTFALVRF